MLLNARYENHIPKLMTGGFSFDSKQIKAYGSKERCRSNGSRCIFFHGIGRMLERQQCFIYRWRSERQRQCSIAGEIYNDDGQSVHPEPAARR